MNVGGRSCNFDRNFDRNSEDGRLQHQFWKRTSQHIFGRQPWYSDGIQQSWTGISDLGERRGDGPIRLSVVSWMGNLGASAGAGGIAWTNLAFQFDFLFIL